MAKSTRPSWAGKLRRQLKRAKEEDRGLSRFGADRHKYQLRPPASEKDVAAFEARFHILLPEGYRDFLLWMGNGGAGPFYGLYRLGEAEPGRISDYPDGALPSRQKTYFKKACDSEQNPELRMVLIKMLSHFRVPGMEDQIDALWKVEAYAEAISVICYSGGWAVKEVWWPRVLEKMSSLRGQPFWDACGIFSVLKDYPEIHAGLLRDQLYRTDLDRNDKNVLFHCLSKLNSREEVLDYFLDYLPDERNHERAEYTTLIYAIWVTKGIKEPRLERIWTALLDKFRTTQDAQDDFAGSQMHLTNDCCLGASHPFGVICSNLMDCLDRFGLDYREAWKLLMDNEHWANWKLSF